MFLLLGGTATVRAQPLSTPLSRAPEQGTSAPAARTIPEHETAQTAAGHSSAAQDSGKPSSSPLSGFSFSSERGPIQIGSDSLELDYKANEVLYRGHVHASQGSFSLASDTLKLIYGNNFRDIRQVIAEGGVRVAQAGRWATGERAVLNQVEHTVEMTGNPVIHDGPSQVAGDRIVMYLETQKFVVEKARAVIFPQKMDSRDNNL